MPKRPKKVQPTRLVQEWTLSPAATLGSAVRAKGILLEIRARLPAVDKKLVDVEAGTIVLRVPENAGDDWQALATIVSDTLVGIEALPVIPRETEDILSISSAERHRWLKDGRLLSAGTRTVKLRGRAQKITFHVFDPRHIEDVMDRGMPDVWREEDAIAAAENRRRAAGKAALTRAGKALQSTGSSGKPAKDGTDIPRLNGWEEFDLDGLLR
jgi:hypothetical protein